MTPPTRASKPSKSPSTVRGPGSPGHRSTRSMDIDELMEVSPSEIKDVDEAKVILEKNLLVILGEEITIDALRASLWHISQRVKMPA